MTVNFSTLYKFFLTEGASLPGNGAQKRVLMTHKYRGSIIVLSISKSVEPNEEQKEIISSFQYGILYKH